MAVSKLFNLLAITTLALFATSFNATPVTALSVGHEHVHRHVAAHEGIARRSKRSNTRRCKQRPTGLSSSADSAPTSKSEDVPKTSTSVATSASAAVPAKSSPAGAKEPSSSEPAPPPSSKAPAPASSKALAPVTTKAPAPVTTKAAAPSPAPPANTGSSGKPKIGIAWNDGNDPSLGNLITPHVGWVYTWSPWAPDNRFGLEFVPMLWGFNQESDFNKLVVSGYAHNALFVNEPNQDGQSTMSPQDAANLWNQQFQPKAALGYSLWSPAVTNAPSGETWMDQFLDACKGCSISHMALHFYDTNPQNLINYVEHWHSKYGMPIAITEFACENFGGGAQATTDEVWSFYQTVMPWLVAQDYVEAIFPFGFLSNMGNVNPANQLMSNGQLTDLGKYIVGGNY